MESQVATNIEPQLCEPKTFDIRVDTSSESPVLMTWEEVAVVIFGGRRKIHEKKSPEKKTVGMFFLAVARL